MSYQLHDIGDWRMSRMKNGIQFMSFLRSGPRADVREQRGRVHPHLRAAVRNDSKLHPDEALRLSANELGLEKETYLTADLRCIQCHINYMTLDAPKISSTNVSSFPSPANKVCGEYFLYLLKRIRTTIISSSFSTFTEDGEGI